MNVDLVQLYADQTLEYAEECFRLAVENEDLRGTISAMEDAFLEDFDSVGEAYLGTIDGDD